MQQFQRGASPHRAAQRCHRTPAHQHPADQRSDTAIGAQQRWLKATGDQGGAESAERQSTDQPPIRGDT